MNCIDEPSTCSECEKQMSKCVHKITSEIYATYDLAYPYGKRESKLLSLDKFSDKIKKSVSGKKVASPVLANKITERCEKPGLVKHKNSYLNLNKNASIFF